MSFPSCSAMAIATTENGSQRINAHKSMGRSDPFGTPYFFTIYSRCRGSLASLRIRLEQQPPYFRNLTLSRIEENVLSYFS
jgi:hypothetical protein